MKPSLNTVARLLLVTIILLALSPWVFVQSAPRPKLVYEQLAQTVSTSPGNNYPIITVAFSNSAFTSASILAKVTVIGSPGVLAHNLSVDNGPFAQIGGGDTSYTTGVRATLVTFERLSFASGTHTVTLAVYNGGGTWTIDSGPLTALLIQFD